MQLDCFALKLAAVACLSLFASVLVAAAGPTTNAPAVTLAWDKSPDANVVGYSVYYGASSRVYTNSIRVPGATNTTCTVSNLVRGTTYFFAATAWSTNLESDYSAEVSYTTVPLPPPPINVTITVTSP